jgi:guanyl-specific ribonuclease Sa
VSGGEGPGGQKALDVLEQIDQTGSNLSGYLGGQPFRNLSGDLPAFDSAGDPITYQEWDVNPYVGDPTQRGVERLVTGSDGSAWFTDNHYGQFDNGNPPFLQIR